MKRLLALALLLISIATPVVADTTMTLTEPTHRSVTGVFINDELASSITPRGRLGKLLFERSGRVDKFVIDVSLLEEIQDLADGYRFIDELGEEIEIPEFLIAQIWLDTLRNAVRGKRVIALPYGNPDREFLEKKAPGEYEFLKETAQVRLRAALSVPVEQGDSLESGGESNQLLRNLSDSYRKSLRITNSAIPAPEIATLRLRIAQLLSPDLPKYSVTPLAADLSKALRDNSQRLRIAGGNYTITSSKYDLPVTVTNDFSVPAKINLFVRATNPRVVVGFIEPLTIPAKSQLQVKVPLEVIASGDTRLEFKFITSSGAQVGQIQYIPVRLAVISPITTWFTTGMAIIFLLAAVIQSFRRIKGRKER
jgi:hypothetical protein